MKDRIMRARQFHPLGITTRFALRGGKLGSSTAGQEQKTLAVRPRKLPYELKVGEFESR